MGSTRLLNMDEHARGVFVITRTQQRTESSTQILFLSKWAWRKENQRVQGKRFPPQSIDKCLCSEAIPLYHSPTQTGCQRGSSACHTVTQTQMPRVNICFPEHIENAGAMAS